MPISAANLKTLLAPSVETVAESPGGYRTGSLADALSAWLESSQQVRQTVDALFETQAARKKVRS